MQRMKQRCLGMEEFDHLDMEADIATRDAWPVASF